MLYVCQTDLFWFLEMRTCCLSAAVSVAARGLGMTILVVLLRVACLLHFVNPSALFLEHFIRLLYVNYCILYDIFLFGHLHHIRRQRLYSALPSIFFISYFCRNVQPRCQRHGRCPSSTSADDCSASDSSACCTLYWWAHPAEPMESAATGAASAHTQTGIEQVRN